MRVSYLTMGFACLSYLGLGLAPTQVSAQFFGGSPLQRPADKAQPAPNPVQPVPTAAAPQAPAASAAPTAAVGPSQGQPDQQGRIVRGSQLIGLNIRGSDDHQLGVVKDFILDSQGECPMIYFAVEPDASLQLGQEYVIMPYSAMQYRSDSRGGGDYFALNVIGSGLRNAPHVAVNAWSNFNDRQLLGNVHQFYQRTERTTARPIEGGAAQPKEQGSRPDGATPPNAGTTQQPEAAPRLDNNTQPKAAPQPDSATRPAAAQAENRERPATGTQPDSKVKEPVEQPEPRR